MSTNEQKSEPFLSKRRLGWAGVVAVIGRAAWCALPVLVAVGVGSGATMTVTRFLKPGSELVVGVAVFAIALGVMAVRARMKRDQSCRPSCSP
jgi:membrane protein DedA with SNARE-associated domain